MFTQARSAFNNRLLDAISENSLARLRPHLSLVMHKQNDWLYNARANIDFVYFPTTCVASVLTIMRDGDAIEVTSVGNEGLIGHTVAMRNRVSVNRVMIQIAGASFRMTASALEVAVAEDEELEAWIDRFSEAYMFQTAQSVACNGLHRLSKRCCRWLLTARDRVNSNHIALTHEYLSHMLGVRRASVTDVLAPLQAQGLLHSHRGIISLLDPEAIEARACECYHAIRDAYDAMLNPMAAHV